MEERFDLNFVDHKNEDIRKLVAQTTEDNKVATVLAHDKSENVREGLAENKNDLKYVNNIDKLERLSAFKNEEDKQWMKEKYAKADSSPDLLDVLAIDKSEKVREEVSLNKNTSEDTLVKLSDDDSSYVRSAVASRNIESVEEKLSKDEYSMVRESVAKNSENQKILKELSKDESDDVKLAVAKNRNSSEEILQDLKQNSKGNIDIFDAADTRLKSIEKSRDFDTARNSSSAEELDKLADKTSDKQILSEIIKNNNVSEETLHKLSESKHEEISNKAAEKMNEKESLSLSDAAEKVENMGKAEVNSSKNEHKMSNNNKNSMHM